MDDLTEQTEFTPESLPSFTDEANAFQNPLSADGTDIFPHPLSADGADDFQNRLFADGADDFQDLLSAHKTALSGSGMAGSRRVGQVLSAVAVLCALLVIVLGWYKHRAASPTVSGTDFAVLSPSSCTAASATAAISPTDTDTAAAMATSASASVSATAPTAAPTKQNPDGSYQIVVYTLSQSAVVYGKDADNKYSRVIRAFTCSTGKSTTPTRTGTYHIRAKYRWRYLVGGVYGQYCSSISRSYLFHSVPYYQKNAATLENEEYDKLGTPASKGCIRMCVRDCKWIYDNCPIGTEVVIINAPGPSGAGVPLRSPDAAYSGWDPSDQWADGNPYFAPSAPDSTATTAATTAASTTAAASQTAAETAPSATASSQAPSDETPPDETQPDPGEPTP